RPTGRHRAFWQWPILARWAPVIIVLFLPLAVRAGEALGPASRSTALVISEIMYHPLEQPDTEELEFIEIYNSNPWPEEISGYSISGSAHFHFPTNTWIQGNSFVLLSTDPTRLRGTYSIPASIACFGTDSLPNSQGSIRLKNGAGAVVTQVDYSGDSPWPVLADGKGYSLVLARPSLGQNDPRAWTASANPGGSPGVLEPASTNALKAVVINEVLANAIEPNLDFIELYNRGDQDMDISGCGLTDTLKSTKFVFEATIIPAHSYLALDEFILGFSLKPEGETVYFRAPDGIVLDAVRPGVQDFDVSLGRVPEGGEEWRALFPSTPFAPNDTRYRSDVVINEIMYAPITGDSEDEYVELFNRSTNSVDLSGWKLSNGIDFSFPAATRIRPSGYVVVA